MSWHDVLFAHWPVPIESLRPLVPQSLPIDVFDDSAWIGIVAFEMIGVRPRGVPKGLGKRFLELNVRTYVTVGEKPGVYFFCLDAESPLAVYAARGSWGLPYFRATMNSHTQANGAIAYRSTRVHPGTQSARFEGQYQPLDGCSEQSVPGSFAHFMSERYCLYTVGSNGQPRRGEIHHMPWPLQPASASLQTQTLTDAIGLPLAQAPPQLHFARDLDVLAWLPRKV